MSPPTFPGAERRRLDDSGGGACYWVGEAMGKVDFKDLPKAPEPVEETARMLASNAAHLATMLKGSHYPGVPQQMKPRPRPDRRSPQLPLPSVCSRRGS